MKPRKKRLVTVMTCVLGVSVLAGFALLHRRALVDYWHLLELRLSGPERQVELIETLRDRRSLRAVPRLVELMETSERAAVRDTATLALGHLGSGIGTEAIEAVAGRIEKSISIDLL